MEARPLFGGLFHGHGVMFMTKEAGLLLCGQLFLYARDLVSVASPAPVHSRLWREIFLGRTMADNAFHIHQPVLSFQPYLCLINVTFFAVLAGRLHMGLARAERRDRENERQHNQ